MTLTGLVAVVLSSTASSWASPPPVAPTLDPAFVTEVNSRWRGLGLGYDNGLWGDAFGQGVRADIPFGPKLGQFVGLRLRGVMIHEVADGYAPSAMGGVELFGRGPVYGGVLRVYGGGGLWYGGSLADPEGASGLAGGGHYGIEALLTRSQSFTFEIGGQAGIGGDGPGAGASVMAGTNIYFGGR